MEDRISGPKDKVKGMNRSKTESKTSILKKKISHNTSRKSGTLFLKKTKPNNSNIERRNSGQRHRKYFQQKQKKISLTCRRRCVSKYKKHAEHQADRFIKEISQNA